jgi:hypothetical protein
VPVESPALGFTHLQFEALLTAARHSPDPCDFALVAMFGLLGLRIFEAPSADIADLGEEHGHRVLRVCGKGTKIVLIPLPPPAPARRNRSHPMPCAACFIRRGLSCCLDLVPHSSGADRERYANVRGLTTPSASIPFLLWNARSARSVAASNAPLCGIPRRRCTQRTRSPAAPLTMALNPFRSTVRTNPGSRKFEVLIGERMSRIAQWAGRTTGAELE